MAKKRKEARDDVVEVVDMAEAVALPPASLPMFSADELARVCRRGAAALDGIAKMVAEDDINPEKLQALALRGANESAAALDMARLLSVN